MKDRVVSILLVIVLVFSLCSCGSTGPNSSFSIKFIDVGQGDAALIECDGHHMLIDGGDKKHGENVYRALEQEQVRRLDILVISHFHEDHYAGILDGIKNVTKIDKVISNEDTYLNGKGEDEDVNFEDSREEEAVFADFNHAISMAGVNQITIPKKGEKYYLGRAVVEVVDVASGKNNDSLVLLVTYGDTKFLFTGDIEENAQKRISDNYANVSDKEYKIDLIKMPHHGSYTGTLYNFFRTFMPDYVVISVGANNRYGHPDQKTLDMMTNDKSGWKPKIYRTDLNGDIVVLSDGKTLSVKTTR